MSLDKSKLQKEILDSLPDRPHGRLILAPRTGKTKLTIDIIKKNKPKSILWVTPEANLANTDIPNEFIKWKAKTYLKRLTTSTWASLNKVTGHFEMVILDESQFMTLNNLSSISHNLLTYAYMIAMTGTESKHLFKKELMKNMNLPVLYDFNINEAVDTGILSDYNIKVIQIPLSDLKEIPGGNKSNPFLTSERLNYEYVTRVMKQAMAQGRKDVKFRILARMRAISNSPSKFRTLQLLKDKLTGRKLYFCPTIECAEKLSHQTYHSKTGDTYLKAFKEHKTDELALVNAGGTGHTYSEVNHLIVTQVDSDKNGLTSQKISRSLLKQDNFTATIWILCLMGTQDENWVESAIANFDRNKVEYIPLKTLKL